MRSFLLSAISIPLACLILTGCKSTPSCLSIVPPEINLTGEKTVIERQIIGDYMELEKDAWTVSSIRTTIENKDAVSRGKGDPAVIKAINARESRSGSLREYKSEGAVGEANTGFVAYISNSRYESSPELKKSLLKLIEDENTARRDIFIKSLEGGDKRTPGENEIESFGRMFADEQRGFAKKGDWVQENSGKWIRRK